MCCMWESLINWHILLLYMEITVKMYAVVALLSLYGFCQALACADWFLLCGRYSLYFIYKFWPDDEISTSATIHLVS